MAPELPNADARGRGRVGVELRTAMARGAVWVATMLGCKAWGLVHHQRNVNQLNTGPRLINSTEEKLNKQSTHSIHG